jgi:hypothetical protein
MSGYRYTGKSLPSLMDEYRGEDLSQQDIYNQLMDSRRKLEMQKSQGLIDEAPVLEPGVGSAATGQPEPMMPKAQPNKLESAGDLAMAGGMAGANPYVAGAGIALKGIGMVDNAKRQQEQAQIDAYNAKVNARRQTFRNMFA